MATYDLMTLNGQLPKSGILSSSNLSDDYTFIARAAGTLDLSTTGLPSNATLVLKDTTTGSLLGSTDGKYTLAKGDSYLLRVQENPPSNSSGSGNGSGSTGSGSGGTGGSTGGTGGSTTGGTGSSTSVTTGHRVVELSYSGSVTSLSPLTPYQIGAGTGYAPAGLNLGSAFSGKFDIDLDNGLLVTYADLNGQALSPAPGYNLGEVFSNAIVVHGYSSDPSVGYVTIGETTLGYGFPFLTPGIPVTGAGFNNQPLAPGLPYTTGGNTDYLGASSDNVVITSLGLISSGSSSNGGSTGSSTGNGSGAGSGSTGSGSGSAGGTGSTGGIPNVAYTLIFTADYAGDMPTTADQEITLTSVKDSVNTKYTGALQDWIGKQGSDTVDLYRFQVSTKRDTTDPLKQYSGANVSIKVSGLPAGVNVSVVKSDGSTDAKFTYNAQSGTLFGILGEATSSTINPTNYYIKVTSTVDTNYTLNVELTETPLTTNLTYTTTGNTPFLTNLWEFDASGKLSTAGIAPNKQTVLIIHGWNKSGAIEYGKNDSIADLAKAIASNHLYDNEQVLALDWGQAATDPGIFKRVPFTVAGRVVGVADWAYKELKALGIAPTTLTLIGHSLGTYVAAEIGKDFGRVGNLYALDPAGPYAITTYNLNAANNGNEQIPRFDSVALRSYAFFSPFTPADDSTQARTANYAFVVRYPGDKSLQREVQIQNHFAGVSALRGLVNKSRISLTFVSPTFLAAPKRYQYNLSGDYDLLGSIFNRNGQYDGVIRLSSGGSNSNVTSFQYISSQSNKQLDLVAA